MEFLPKHPKQDPSDRPKPRLSSFSQDTKPEFEEIMDIDTSPSPGITLHAVLRGHTSTVSSINWSPDGRYMATPSYNQALRIWDIQERRCASDIISSYGDIFCSDWSPDGSLITAGTRNGRVLVWNAKNQHMLYTYQMQGGGIIHDIAWLGEEGLIAILHNNQNTIDIININSGALKLSLKNVDTPRSVIWSKSLKKAFSGTFRSGFVRFSSDGEDFTRILYDDKYPFRGRLRAAVSALAERSNTR